MHLAVAALAAALLWLGLCVGAVAHGSGEWVAQSGLRNAAGQLCCGEKDCGVLVDGKVSARVDGYQVDGVFEVTFGDEKTRIQVREFVPYSETLPSPDGAYWRCAWGGERKCFFVPPPGS